MVDLQTVVAICTILAFVGGVVAWLWAKSYRAKSLSDRPYPCKEVLDLKEKIGRHDQYLSTDRKNIESLDKRVVRVETTIEGMGSDVAEIKSQTNKILMLLIESKSK